MSDADGALKYLRKAERALDGARVLLKAEATEGACNRAYYAMHDAAHAALLATGHESLKTHQGLIAAFGQRFVQTGQLETEFGRSLNRVQVIRLAADYATDPPDLADATDAVAQAERFVAAIRGILAP